jgi:probable rRNA maturation factor
VLGDLVLCAPVIAREAREQGKPLRPLRPPDRARRAAPAGHGTTTTTREAECMEQLEREILAGLGIDDPYRGH